MRWRSVVVALGLATYVTAFPSFAKEDLANTYSSALVLIRAFEKEAEGDTPIYRGFGTGWLVSYDGFVITARHVVTANDTRKCTDLVLRGEVRGTQFDIDWCLVLEDFDAALLKLKWPPQYRPDTVFEFERFRLEPLLDTGALFSYLGFPNGDKLDPSVFTAHISQSGGVYYLSDEPIPQGMSGGPAIVVEDGDRVFAMALATTEDAEGKEIRGVFLPVKWLRRLVDHVMYYGNPRKLIPPWLPSPPTQLYRSAELAEILEYLKTVRDGGTVLIVDGPGLEARELAIQVGHQAWREIGDLSNILYVDASPRGDKPRPLSEILAALLYQLNKDPKARESDEMNLAALRDTLREPKTRLIILEDVRSEEDLHTILGSRGRASILATSPNHFLLPRFDLPPVLLRALPPDDCVVLFKNESSLPLSAEADLTKVKEICRLLGGVPRAIRWASAIVGRGGVSLSLLLEQLQRESQLENLEVAIAFGPAYNRLQNDEKHVLMTISVIGGESFDSKATLAVSKLDTAATVEWILRRLVWANLIEQVSDDRFRVNHLLRRLARRKLQEAPPRGYLPEQEMVRYYLEQMQLDAQNVSREWSNILHALQTCHTYAGETDTTQCLGRGMRRLAPFMRYIGEWTLHQEWVRRWYESAKASGDITGQRAALRALGEEELKRGHDEKARNFLEEAKGLPNPEGDPETVRIYYALAGLEFQAYIAQSDRKKEQLEKSGSLIHKGLKFTSQLSDEAQRVELAAKGHHNLGIVAAAEGDFGKAQEEFKESLEIAKGRNLVDQLIRTYYQLAMLAMLQGKPADAKTGFGRSLELARKEGYEEARAHSLLMLGVISQEEGNRDLAEKYLSEAIVVYRRLESPYLEQTMELLKETRAPRSGS